MNKAWEGTKALEVALEACEKLKTHYCDSIHTWEAASWIIAALHEMMGEEECPHD